MSKGKRLIIAQTQEEEEQLQKEKPNDFTGTPSEYFWSSESLDYFRKFGCKVVDTTKIPTGTVVSGRNLSDFYIQKVDGK